jgi:hypothetical protein
MFTLPVGNFITLRDCRVMASTVTTAVVTTTSGPLVDLVRLFDRLFGKSGKPRQETTQTRTNRVITININPRRMVAYQSQRINFSAIGKGGNGETLQGARFDWTSSDPKKLAIDDSGQATCIASGLVWVTASTSFTSARVPVLIRPGTKPIQTDDQWQADQDQLKPDGTISTVGSADPTNDGRPAADEEASSVSVVRSTAFRRKLESLMSGNSGSRESDVRE